MGSSWGSLMSCQNQGGLLGSFMKLGRMKLFLKKKWEKKG